MNDLGEKTTSISFWVTSSKATEILNIYQKCFRSLLWQLFSTQFSYFTWWITFASRWFWGHKVKFQGHKGQLFNNGFCLSFWQLFKVYMFNGPSVLVTSVFVLVTTSGTQCSESAVPLGAYTCVPILTFLVYSFTYSFIIYFTYIKTDFFPTAKPSVMIHCLEVHY